MKFREETLPREPNRVVITYTLGSILILALLGAAGPLLAVDRSEAAAGPSRRMAQSENLALVGEYIQPGLLGRGVYVAGHEAYMVDIDNGLQVIDVSTPAVPTEGGVYNMPGDGAALDVYVAGHYAYVAKGGLHVIDVSNPARLSEVSAYETPWRASGVYVAGNRAYVAAGGLYVVDVSDPATPEVSGPYAIAGSAWGVYVTAPYAYVATENAGLRIIDVADPAALREVGPMKCPACLFATCTLPAPRRTWRLAGRACG